MSLTVSQKTANAVFFEKTFLKLNPNGYWFGDGCVMKKVGEKFVPVDMKTYEYVKINTPEQWFNRRVVLPA